MSAPNTAASSAAAGITVQRLPAGASIGVGGHSVHLSHDEIDDLVKRLTGHRDRRAKRQRRGTGASAVAQLVDAGLLKPGEELMMRTGGKTHTAEVLADGRLVVDGHIKDSPTEAASFVALARRSGWRAWANTTGETLEAIRWRWRVRELFESDSKEIVEAWVDFCVRQRLSPGTADQLLFQAFVSERDIRCPSTAFTAIIEWAVWCRQHKFIRDDGPPTG